MARKRGGLSEQDSLLGGLPGFDPKRWSRANPLLGTGRVVDGPDAKLEALRCLSDRTIPGRWDHVRPPNKKELEATSVVAIEINQASAKVRKGPPGDDGEDLEFPVWAGVFPLPVVPQPAETDPKQ